VARLTDSEQKTEVRHRVRELNMIKSCKLPWGDSASVATKLYNSSAEEMHWIGPNAIDIHIARKKGKDKHIKERGQCIKRNKKP
jgi:hypothetical protein